MTNKKARAISVLPVKRKREKANDNMRRSSSTSERVRVPTMNETMQEMMEREKAETIRTLNLANSALSRLFGIEEEEENE
jgi:lysylphosphatidylglycerol synthetase-like protein (DUF2156 family)